MSVPPAAEEALDAIAAGSTAHQLEGEALDFKTVGRSRNDALRDLAEAAACFANGRGGVLIVGVADRIAGPAALVGTDLDPQRTQRRIYEFTEPHLVVTCEAARRHGADMLVITVPASADVHAVGGRSTERIGSSCEPMSSVRIGSVVAERRGDDWSAEDSEVSLAPVDPAAMTFARSLLAQSADPARQTHAQRSDADLLRALGVVTDRRTLTNAGALLFTAMPRWRDLVTYIHRRTPAGTLVADDRRPAPLMIALERVFDAIEVRTDSTPVNLPRGQQVMFADLPQPAVRESIVNAVTHRDYRRTEPVVIEHAATRLAVSSPGPFVSGVTVDNVLTTSSRPRNPALATAIRTLGLAETAGTGVDRMYAEMVRLGHQPPRFEADLEGVRVVLLGGAPNAQVARFVASLPPEEANDADTMLVLLNLLTHRTTTAEKIAPLLQKPMAEAEAVLRRVESPAVSLVERTRESARRAHPTYRLREHAVAALGSALAYHRRSPDQADRKIIGVLAESGEINATVVRLLLDLDASAASRRLADLVRRGILTKTSAAQRGRGVTYGPGPKFPAKVRGRSRVGQPSDESEG